MLEVIGKIPKSRDFMRIICGTSSGERWLLLSRGGEVLVPIAVVCGDGHETDGSWTRPLAAVITPRVGWLHYRCACLRASQPLSEALIVLRMDRGWEVRSCEVVTRAPTSRSSWCDESFVRRQCRMA